MCAVLLCPCYLQRCLGIVVLLGGLGALSLTQRKRWQAPGTEGQQRMCAGQVTGRCQGLSADHFSHVHINSNSSSVWQSGTSCPFPIIALLYIGSLNCFDFCSKDLLEKNTLTFKKNCRSRPENES